MKMLKLKKCFWVPVLFLQMLKHQEVLFQENEYLKTVVCEGITWCKCNNLCE